MKLIRKLRAAGVKRWHIIEVSREQNLAEHQFNVTMIARRIGEMCGLTESELNALAWGALNHDQHEIDDGDTPSTAKSEKPLEKLLVPRIIQVADKMEALWFIQHRHINRSDVVLDVEQRLVRLRAQADSGFERVIDEVCQELGIVL